VNRHDAITHLRANRQTLHELGVASLALFGSVVRDEASDMSDIDVLVRFSKPVGLFEFLEVKNYLEDLMGIEVDLVTEDALKPQLRERILAEAVPIG
jgi:predicted nucleotidyltransferase